MSGANTLGAEHYLITVVYYGKTMTVSNNSAVATKPAAKVNKPTEAVAVVAAPIDQTPKPTGLMGGAGEFYFWPELNVYAAMDNGKPHDFKLTPDNWELMKSALVPVSAVKSQVVNATKAAAAPKLFVYTITATITFETTEVIEPATHLGFKAVRELANEYGFIGKVEDGPFTLSAGKAKGGSSRTSTGESKGSGFIKAESFEELRPLGEKAMAVAKAMHKENTNRISLDRWHEFGYANRQAFVDSRSNDWYRKGYNGAMSSGGGYITLYPERMYSGYTLLDTLDKA